MLSGYNFVTRKSSGNHQADDNENGTTPHRLSRISVVSELGRKAGEKLPRIGRRRPRPDPRAPPSEIALLLPSQLASKPGLPHPSRGWGETRSITANGVLPALRPPRQIFSCPLSVSVSSQHLFNRAKSARTLPRWFTMSRGRLYKHSAVAITLGTLP
jgi:hypothetical protein